MQADPESYKPFRDDLLAAVIPWDDYLRRVATDQQFWGGNVELKALCDTYKTQLTVMLDYEVRVTAGGGDSAQAAKTEPGGGTGEVRCRSDGLSPLNATVAARCSRRLSETQ